MEWVRIFAQCHYFVFYVYIILAMIYVNSAHPMYNYLWCIKLLSIHEIATYFWKCVAIYRQICIYLWMWNSPANYMLKCLNVRSLCCLQKMSLYRCNCEYDLDSVYYYLFLGNRYKIISQNFYLSWLLKKYLVEKIKLTSKGIYI